MLLGRKLMYRDLVEMERQKVAVKDNEERKYQLCEVSILRRQNKMDIFMDNRKYSFVMKYNGEKMSDYEVYRIRDKDTKNINRMENQK